MGLRDAGLEEGPVFEFVYEETHPGKGAKTTLIEPMAFRPGTRRRRQARRQGQSKRKKSKHTLVIVDTSRLAGEAIGQTGCASVYSGGVACASAARFAEKLRFGPAP